MALSEAVPLRQGEARIGDLVTPRVRISVLGGEPSFEPGDPLVVRDVTGVRGCLLRVEDQETGTIGLWAVDCFGRLPEKE